MLESASMTTQKRTCTFSQKFQDTRLLCSSFLTHAQTNSTTLRIENASVAIQLVHRQTVREPHLPAAAEYTVEVEKLGRNTTICNAKRFWFGLGNSGPDGDPIENTIVEWVIYLKKWMILMPHICNWYEESYYINVCVPKQSQSIRTAVKNVILPPPQNV